MQKQKVINVFKSSHKNFRDSINLLTPDELITIKVLGNWTVKDIIAHLSAWNWEQAKEINNILQNKPTWDKKYKTKKDEDYFNKQAVDERKNKNAQSIIEEWENSFKTLLNRIEKLREEECNLKDMQLLFRYEENGLSDEGEHANQIRKFFNQLPV